MTVLAAAVSLLVLACDVLASHQDRPWYVRAVPAGAALIALALLARGDRPSLGLTLRPRQGWLHWLKLTAALAGIALAFILAVGGAFLLLRIPMPQYRLFSAPSDFWPWALSACVAAPLLEEALYRLVLCAPAAAVLPPWAVVLLSGAVFAALHFVYGNPAPDNFIAGFLLGWAYLRSGSLAVPIALHSLGNLCVGLAQVAWCCWSA